MNSDKFEIEVLNVSKNAYEYEYMVVRICDGQVWYYGADHEEWRAKEVASAIGNAFVIPIYKS